MAGALTTTIMGTITAMAIPNEVGGVWIAAPFFLARTFVCLLGLGAVAWGGFVLPVFQQQARVNRVASELLQGHAFKIQALLDEVRQVEASESSSFCNPTELHDAVVIRLAIPDEAIAAADHTPIDSAQTSFYNLARKALACAPANSLVWLTLFWLDASKNGFTQQNANYLLRSHAVGPNEGWIALWRNRLAMPLFEQLPADLSDDAIDEFIRLVDTGLLSSETAAIFASTAPAAQSRIIEHLKTTKAIPRQNFARALYDKGLDVNIPDVEMPGARPWQ